MIDKVREIALKILYEIDKEQAYTNIALDEKLKEIRKKNKSTNIKKEEKEEKAEELSQRDIGFISEIVYGTISWKLTIDEVIKKHSNVKLKKISPWILNILRMSIYQILFLDKVPKSAAVNEGVNLAKRYGHRASSNFVNAILRKVEKKDYEDFFLIKNNIERISKTTSMPEWIVEELLKDNTVEKVEDICKYSNMKPKLYARVNTLETDKQKLIEELQKDDIQATNASIDNFLVLNGAKNIEQRKSFKEGLFTIQDEGAGLIPLVLNPKPNEIILDACSSPGGKTTFMAELMQNKGEIIAWDLHEHRVKLVDAAAKRLGINIIKTKIKDATVYEEKYFEFFDKILLDVPCLGIGVLKRKPDIKWKRKKEDIDEIVMLQQQILENCSKMLKINGELVYSTCSIFKEENEEVIFKFLENNKNFKIEKINFINEDVFKKFVEKDGYIKMYQNENTDGFFICKMRRYK